MNYALEFEKVVFKRARQSLPASDEHSQKINTGDKSMKKSRLFTVIGVVIALCIAIALYMFVSPKSTKNIPELSSIAQMEEAEVNQLIVGYSRNQLIEVWGEPDISGNNEDRWQLSTTATLVVNTNNKGEVVVCGILQ